MGKLENIIARNQRPKRLPEKVLVSMVFGLIVLLVIALAVFTDLGQPPGYVPSPPRGTLSPAPPAEPVGGSGADLGSGSAEPRGKRVDGVLLRAAPAR